MLNRQQSYQCTLSTTKARWDGERDPSNIQEVWEYVGVKLRETKDLTREIIEDFYGYMDRLQYLMQVNDAIKLLLERMSHKNKRTIVDKYTDLEEMLIGGVELSPRMRASKGLDTVRIFVDKSKQALSNLQKVKYAYAMEILNPLEMYCSNYVSLGTTDDRFYRSLKGRIVSIRTTLKHFSRIMLGLNSNLPVSSQYFSDSDLSEEISIQLDCESIPLLRYADFFLLMSCKKSSHPDPHAYKLIIL